MTSKTFVNNSTPAVDADWLNDADKHIYGVKRYGALGDGSTNDATAINAAITAANTAGGGIVYFPYGNYAFSSGITLKSNVLLVSDAKAKLTWTGGASVAITSGTTTLLQNAGILGLNIVSGTASKVLELNSAIYCTFKDIKVTGNSATQYVIDLQCNGSGETNAWGNRNVAFNHFENIIQDGTIGTGLRMQGDGPTGGPPTAVVTLNTFLNICFAGVSVRGFDFAEWCDSNFFNGIAYAYLIANNAVGCEFNTANPTGNHGVYANNFDHLAVDSFGTYTGRVGLKLNFCKNIQIENFFNDPIAEGGDVVIDATNAYSYRIGHHKGGTNSIYWYEKGTANRGDTYEFGHGQSTGTVTLQIGGARTNSGTSLIDLIGDTSYTDYGTRLARIGGPNANTQLVHRGTGNLALQAVDAGGGITLLDSGGVARVAVNNTGLGFHNTTPVAKGTITGAKGGNVALANLITYLASIGLFTDSTT